MNARVRTEVTDHVAVVTLDRPDKHNALDGPMFEGLLAAAEEVARTTGVRVVVLHGAGPSFCSGLDFASILAGPVTLDDLLTRGEGRRGTLAQRACTDWIDLPMPVIAALHGTCFGGGLQIALGADIRIASADARLSLMEVNWGLVADMGVTVTLPRLVSADVAKELAYTGRVVAGAEAAAMGLVTRVADDPLDAALALAREIAARSPEAVRAAKRLLDTTWNGPPDASLVLETELQRALVGAPNQRAAVTAGLSRQPAHFVDPLPDA